MLPFSWDASRRATLTTSYPARQVRSCPSERRGRVRRDVRRQLRTERFDPSPKRPRRAVLPRPGAAYNDTPVAPRVRRGGRALVAILRPRQSQRAAVCQRPACRVPLGGTKLIHRISTVNHPALPDARDASGKFGIHVITSFSSFLSFPTSTTPCVDVEPVRRSAYPMPLRRIILPSTNPTGGMPYLSIRTHRL